jgi:hypothetical protein
MYSGNNTFNEKDKRAKGIIIKYISDRLALQIASKPSAKEMFDKIVHIHKMQNTGICAFFLFTKLTTTAWDPDTTGTKDHISKFRNASTSLTQMGCPISNEFLAFFLLHSLPHDLFWDNFRTTITQSVAPNTLLKFDDVDSRLQMQVISLKGTSNGTTASKSALKATTSSCPFTPCTGSSTLSCPMKMCKHHGQNTTYNTKLCCVLKREKEEKEEKKRKKGKEKEKAHSMSHNLDLLDSDSAKEVHVTTLSNKLRSRLRLYFMSDPSDKCHHRIADTSAS